MRIAIESGLRIGPEQYSNLLYGKNANKSQMQSILDKVCVTAHLVLMLLVLVYFRTWRYTSIYDTCHSKVTVLCPYPYPCNIRTHIHTMPVPVPVHVLVCTAVAIAAVVSNSRC